MTLWLVEDIDLPR